MRLVESPHYTDAALSVYVKVKALGLRPEGCTAGIATLASYLGLSPSTVQRGLAQLRSVAPDGVVELPDSRRRSLPGGFGTTARRRVRPMRPTERFIWLPVAASEHLRPRLLRAYAIISYAVIQKIPLTERVLAGFLRHHSGHRAGQALSLDAAGRIVDELADSGWVSVERRAGMHGRHIFHIPSQQAPLSSVVDDRSGSAPHERSLANKEDLKTDRLENEGEPLSPAVGEVPVVKAVDNSATKTTHPLAEASGNRALRADDTTSASSPTLPSPTLPAPKKSPYRGPQLTFSTRLHAALEPVRFLLADVNAYMLRRIGREAARQLDDCGSVQRLQARLTLRLARTFVDDIQDPGRWLLGVALPRWGCANPDCEAGVLWSTGAECGICREVVFRRAAARRKPASGGGGQDLSRRDNPVPKKVAVPRVVECCPNCERPHSAGNSGICSSCRRDSIPVPLPAPGPDAPTAMGCQGRNGTCGRPTPQHLCWRCRMEAEACTREHPLVPTDTP
ncbi:hypothetical protein ACIRSU_35225 [Streptomyces sp. NPDC101160]|uniref:hypothetical protein n=1 Tax=Streptomyces sp. NPDC101160 TaxID=3366118 RepID=UPI00381B8E4F